MASQVAAVSVEVELWVASEEETNHLHLAVLQEGSAARRLEEVATRVVLVDSEASAAVAVAEVEEE